MPDKTLTPKFLTVEMARTAISATLETIYNGPSKDVFNPHREQLHVVVLVPGILDHRKDDFPNWPDYQLKPVLLCEESRGKPEEFEYPFDSIARNKAMQLWTDRNDDRSDCIPHMLFPGDTPYWGGVKRRGIVVTTSGLKPWLDKLISGMVADMLVAMAHQAWMTSDDREKGLDFID